MLGPSLVAWRIDSFACEIYSEYDRLKNRTLITAEVLSWLLSMNPYKLDAYFGYQGKELKSPPRFVLFLFKPDALPGWRFLKDHSVIFLVDNSISVDPGDAIWDGEVGKTMGGQQQAKEYNTAILTLPQFLQLLNGTKVEVRLGIFEHKFREDQAEVMRDLASRMIPKPD